jgi:hypothetical protein
VEASEEGRPGCGCNWVARGGKEEEAAAGRLGVELDDLRVVADSGNRSAEGGGSDDVGGEIEAANHGTASAGGGRGGGWGGPRERGVECDAAVEAVGEEVPLRRNGYGG